MITDLSLRKTTDLFITLFIGGWVLFYGAPLIQPFIYAGMLAVLLNPVEKRISKLIKTKWLSILLSYLAVIIPLGVIVSLMSLQFVDIVESLPSITDKLQAGLQKGIDRTQQYFPGFQQDLSAQNLTSYLKGPLGVVSSGLVSSTAFVANFFLVLLYAFFIAYYQKSIRAFIVYQFEAATRSDIREAINEMKETIQAYVGGMGIMIVLLSVLNSIGLFIIGIKYPVFWGCLAGMLAIVPYIGVALGGILPFLYALATTDTTWQPVAIIIYYIIIQQIEGNLITPKLVGNRVDLNPLAAIFSLLLFGQFWGIGGVVLALPLLSITKIILSNINDTKPIAILLSSDINKGVSQMKQWAKKNSE